MSAQVSTSTTTTERFDPNAYNLVQYHSLFTSQMRNMMLSVSVAVALFGFALTGAAATVAISMQVVAACILAFSLLIAIKASYDFRTMLSKQKDVRASSWELKSSSLWSYYGYGFSVLIVFIAFSLIQSISATA